MMKDRVDKQQVAEYVNKKRQTKTRDVLVQLQKGRNAKDITDVVAANGTEVKLDIIRSGKSRTGWIIARVREKVTVSRCFRCLAFGHLSHNCDSGNNTTKPCFLCRATDHLAANCAQ